MEAVFHALNADADLENLSIDSTCVKAHPQSAGAKRRALNSEFNQFIGTNRGGKNTKIHAIVDGLGNPISFLLSGSQIHDSKMTKVLDFSDTP